MQSAFFGAAVRDLISTAIQHFDQTLSGLEPTTPNWRTSSYTGAENCIEVADNNPTKVIIRDTKSHSDGTLTIQPDTWTAFLEHVKHG